LYFALAPKLATTIPIEKEIYLVILSRSKVGYFITKHDQLFRSVYMLSYKK
jgi:hypothetical protein